MAIRVALTGRTATPPLFESMVALGRERTLERLDRGGARAGGGVAGLTSRAGSARCHVVNIRQRADNARAYPVDAMARTILVVDDEPTLRETLAEALDADGFRVVTAADGREALIRFREHQPGPRRAGPHAPRALRDRGLPDHPRGVAACRS